MAEEKENKDSDASKEFELDTGEKNVEAEAQASSKTKIILIATIGFFTLVAVSVGAYSFLFSSDEQEASEAKVEQVAKSDSSAEIEKKKQALYAPIENDIIATIFDSQGDEHHMVIAVTLMVRENDALKVLEKNKPLLTNNLLELFESQKYSQMHKIESKEDLRKQALQVVRDSMKSQNPPITIESVLFTKFMMD